MKKTNKPQKRSSQLYSVTPKSYVKKPQKKRKRSKPWLLPLLIILTIISLVALILYLLSVHTSGIVSPLQIAVGEKLQTFSSGSDENLVKRLLAKHNILYTAVQTTQDDYVVALNAKQQVFLTKKKDLDTQISSLQVILPRLTMEGREFRRLDMRFEKPVVEY